MKDGLDGGYLSIDRSISYPMTGGGRAGCQITVRERFGALERARE